MNINRVDEYTREFTLIFNFRQIFKNRLKDGLYRNETTWSYFGYEFDAGTSLSLAWFTLDELISKVILILVRSSRLSIDSR